MKKALIFYGGWEGHYPVEIANVFRELLEKNNYIVDMQNNLECLSDLSYLKMQDLIVPIWSAEDKINPNYIYNISDAVASGVGLAGCHGGMCATFNTHVEWHFMTGGQWVNHPGNDGVEYIVNIVDNSSEIIENIKDFKVSSEQYYMHVDPAIDILATTEFQKSSGNHAANMPIKMPVIWIKKWGHGRVFYNSLGHTEKIFVIPEVGLLMERGLIWAGNGKKI